LGDFLDHGTNEKRRRWHEKISEFDTKRKFESKKLGGRPIPTYFVIEGDDNFTTSGYSVRLAWYETARLVSETNLLTDATFLRLDHIGSIKPQERVSKGHEENSLVYFLHPGRMYKLNFAVFDKKERETEVEIHSSSPELFEIGKPSQSAVSGLAEKSSLIACKRTIENRLVALRVYVKAPPGVVNTPDPIFLARIAITRSILWGFILYVFLGTFLIALDLEVVREILSEHHPATMVLVSRIAGAACLARAAFLALRKLPQA
jgi:hypothetical protein